MKSRRYNLIYWVILIFLCLHFLVAKFYSEPYPSLVFPSFSNAGNKADVLKNKFTEFYAVDLNNDTVQVSRKDLVPNAKHLSLIVRTMKRKDSLLHTLQGKEIRANVNALTNMLHDRTRFISRVSQRLSKTHAGKKFQCVLIREYRHNYDETSDLISGIYDEQFTRIELPH